MRITGLLILLLFLASCGRGGEEIKVLLEDVKQDFAPDKRVALFDVRAIKKGGTYLLEGTSNLPEAVESIVDKCKEAGLKIENHIILYPDSTIGNKTYGVVNLSVCNIRSHPAHSSELSTQATLGTPLKVWTNQNGWYLVQTPDGYLGWLDDDGFAPMTEQEMENWQAAEKAFYMPQFGFAYSSTEQSSGVVSDLLAGNILKYIGETEKNLSKVAFPDGREAYVPNAALVNYKDWLSTRNPVAENILADAHEFVGRPYLWGGASGKGMDCSGFTKTVFFLNGIILPRDASQQVHVGSEVAADSTLAGVQPGDLLFFGRKATDKEKEKITHVAIYKGDGKIIHAAGRVKVESLRRGDEDFNEYRLKSLVKVKRMLDTPGENGVQLVRQSPMY